MSATSEAEPVISIWASMATWYTPTPLFLLLNLVIITVAVVAYYTSSSKPEPENSLVHRVFRRPSMEGRVKSANFSFNRGESDPVGIFEDTQQMDKLDQTQSLDSDFYQAQQIVRAPSLLERAKSWKFSFNGGGKTESSERFQNTASYDHLEQTQFVNYDVAPRTTSQSLLARVKSLNLSLRLFEEQTQRDSDHDMGNTSQAPAIKNKPGSDVMLAKTKQSAIGNKMGPDAMPEFGTDKGSGKLPAIGNKPGSGEMSVKIKQLAIEHKLDSGAMQEFETKQRSGKLPEIGERMSSGDMLRKMTKSASEKLIVGANEAENVERRRPETMRERNSGDESVNDKADDFISKFRHQLKLQRMDSMLRYREMIDRGSS